MRVNNIQSMNLHQMQNDKRKFESKFYSHIAEKFAKQLISCIKKYLDNILSSWYNNLKSTVLLSVVFRLSIQ